MTGEWTCTKCGETAISKCVWERSIFPDDRQAALVGNILDVRARALPEEHRFEVTIQAPRWALDQGEIEEANRRGLDPLEEAERRVLNLIRSLTPETLVHLLCRHHWRLPEGVKCDFGHDHR